MFDISGMLGLRPGGKELGRKKHQPMEFRILQFSFSIRNPNSAIQQRGYEDQEG